MRARAEYKKKIELRSAGILENLKAERKGRTTILIAHRITTIEHMDKVIFVEDGSVVDVSSHAELVSRCPKYAEMVEMQRLEDERKASSGQREHKHATIDRREGA